jgi:flagellar M-ring protein FliF
MRSQIEEIVAGIVGQGRARVQVTAELDLNRVESRSESFDPESRVVRSTQTRSENALTGGAEGQVTVGNELPGANQNQAPPQQKDSSQKNEEVTNYEISRVTKVETQEGGRLKRLSVAVLVDGVYAPGADGKPAYQPRSDAEIARITALVRTAVGYDKARGDQVEVVNLRFAETPAAPELAEPGLIQSFLSPTKEEVMRLVELAVLSLLTLVVLMAVVRPLLRRVLESDAPVAALAGPAGALALAGAAGEGPAEIAVRENSTNRFLESAKINGQIQAETVERVVDMVRASPTETVEVLRNWIHDS